MGIGYLKLRVPSLRRESCRVPGISVREAFSTPSMPRASKPGQSRWCLRYEAGFLAQEEQAEQEGCGAGTGALPGHGALPCFLLLYQVLF